MAGATSIEWTESTWNPITGCTKVSSGCANCYAERMAARLQAMGSRSYQNGFDLTIHEHLFEAPLGWRKPRVIFVNSMSDLLHPSVPDPVILKLIEVMRTAHWHTFQILTKRADRLRELGSVIDWPSNVWMGVSVESQRYVSRVEALRQTPARVRFLSCEPLIGEISSMDLTGIDWVIVGGESGPGARPMSKEWVLFIRDLCAQKRVAFFFKQWGGTKKKRTGRLLDGRTYDQMPTQFSQIDSAAL